MIGTVLLIARRVGALRDDPVADEASRTKQEMVIGLAVRQAFVFEMSAATKRLSAAGTAEMLDMPLLAESADDSIVDQSSTSSADGEIEFTMALLAVEQAAYLSSILVQFDSA